jgi:quercetin dioxygenase-like cupin family protein
VRASEDRPMSKFFILVLLFGLAPAAAMAQASPVSSSANVAFNNAISNIPGKSVVAVVVSYPPGAKSPPHHHAGSAFITAYVLEGAVLSQVDGSPPKVFHAGESFTETPGAHHEVSANASTTEPAKLLAVFVVDTGEMPLTIPDK